ncbi:uncharacterized protein LOC119282525 [Triticum dicoccoides]|uniref:uncharacterized protein LOC119282525 n=1 Tax=Triticum dicoccoides TaxID=85692 RepID=UPI00188FA0B4|nr:uncharacterized protein LOC119282525 [Triticum dicoccoides]
MMVPPCYIRQRQKLHPATTKATCVDDKSYIRLSYDWPLQKLQPASRRAATCDRRLGKLQPLHEEATTSAHRSYNRRGNKRDWRLRKLQPVVGKLQLAPPEVVTQRPEMLEPVARRATTSKAALYDGNVFFAGTIYMVMQADDGGEPEAVTMGCCNHGHPVLGPAIGELQSK